MGSKMRLHTNCTKGGDDTVNIITSRKINMTLVRLINHFMHVTEL